MQSLTDVLSDLDTLTSENEFKRKLDHTFSAMGFSRFSYVGMTPDMGLDPDGHRNPQDVIFLTNVPSAWVDHYLESDYQDCDPIIRECYSARLPIRWTENFRANARTERETGVLNDALDFGIRRGFTVPLHGPGGELGIMSLYSELADAEFSRVLQQHQYELLVTSHYFHDAVQRALKAAAAAPKPIPLTDREVEILQWTAIGKTAWEIGSILKISERTVNFHLQNIMAKFGVHNKTHAAAKAMSCGLIRP